MLVSGSKIKLIKPMGVFDNVGEVCEVVKIEGETGICFRFGVNGIHMGYMSFSEYEIYFVPYVEKPKHMKKRWTQWKPDGTVQYHGCVHNLESRNNGKVCEVRTKNMYPTQSTSEYIMAGSSCNKEDGFDALFGDELARTRLVIKIYKMYLDSLINEKYKEEE